MTGNSPLAPAGGGVRRPQQGRVESPLDALAHRAQVPVEVGSRAVEVDEHDVEVVARPNLQQAEPGEVEVVGAVASMPPMAGVATSRPSSP